MFEAQHNSLEAAQKFDQQDSLAKYRKEFEFPQLREAQSCLYFAGHSLGLMPKKTRSLIQNELETWGKYGVEGHFKGEHPWFSYHENLTASLAKLVGAKEREVVAMNALTVNLHLMLVSFYRPRKNKYKILIENNTFPSDKYAVDSHARFHGHDPNQAVVELKPTKRGSMVVLTQNILDQIESLGDELALIFLGNCNYLSGQCFDFEKIVRKGREKGVVVGFNLAHGAGNLLLQLHKWEVDFALWCSYKYLNAGPGGIAGAFVHSRHLGKKEIPRFEGWWGQNKQTRFEMGPQFDPINTVEAWQLSNPPIFQLAALRGSMDIFDEAKMSRLRQKGDHLTSYLEWLLKLHCKDEIEIQTPKSEGGEQGRGSMLCLRFKGEVQELKKNLKKKGAIVDLRKPDILRITPAPLYNSYEDVFRLVEIIRNSF